MEGFIFISHIILDIGFWIFFCIVLFLLLPAGILFGSVVFLFIRKLGSGFRSL